MTTFSDSYVLRVLFGGHDVVARRWRCARPRSEVANEAHAQCTVRELIGNDRGILRQELDQ